MGVLRGLGRAVAGLLAGVFGLLRGLVQGVDSLLRRLVRLRISHGDERPLSKPHAAEPKLRLGPTPVYLHEVDFLLGCEAPRCRSFASSLAVPPSATDPTT
jgi:hypothetical protein